MAMEYAKSGKLLALLMVAGLLQSARAATYTVGDTTGWELGISATFYDDWAKPLTFVEGDILVFNYAGATHNVFDVSKADLASCKLDAPIKTYETTGGASVTLTSGYHGFICAIPGHCLLNMKMNVQVSAAAAPPVTPPTVAPAPAKTPPAIAPAPAKATPTIAPAPANATPTIAPAPANATTPTIAPAPAKTPPTVAPAPAPSKATPTKAPAPAPSTKPLTLTPTPAVLVAPGPPAPSTVLASLAPAPGPDPSSESSAGPGLRSGPVMIVGAVLCVLAAVMFQ